MANVTVQQWSDKAKARLDVALRKTTLEAFAEVVLLSPVDSGRFRSNWNTAIGAAPTGTTDKETYPKGDAIKVKGPIATEVLNNAETVVANFKIGQVAYFANNLPYAYRLEFEAWSDQAPGGMVRLTAQRWQPIVDKVVAQIVRDG